MENKLSVLSVYQVNHLQIGLFVLQPVHLLVMIYVCMIINFIPIPHVDLSP